MLKQCRDNKNANVQKLDSRVETRLALELARAGWIKLDKRGRHPPPPPPTSLLLSWTYLIGAKGLGFIEVEKEK